MLPQLKNYLTPQEYLKDEREAEYRSEYLNGEVFAMAGASRRHNLIVTNIVRELSFQLKKKPCEVYSNDMRVRVSNTGLYTYPDIAVVCGEAVFDDEYNDTLLNPIVIIEVLSDSTQQYDRGEKFAHFRRLESLAEYLLISQKTYLAEHYVRKSGNQWECSETTNPEETVYLPSIHCYLALPEIYDKVINRIISGNINV